MNLSTIFLTQQLMERLKKIVKLPHRLRPVQSSKVSPGPVGECFLTGNKEMRSKKNKNNQIKLRTEGGIFVCCHPGELR